MTGLAIVGTGFVSDYYMATLANHAGLRLIGAWDHDAPRLERFGAHYRQRPFASLEALLADPAVTIVVNLTSPESHFAINKAALEAGKHVYCEKPLALTFEEAQTLVAMARAHGLTLCGAPANGLSEAFDLARTQLGAIGTPRLAYAEMEDGPVFRANWRDWSNGAGVPWPGVHEFEVGCTLEHAGYGLSWLVGLFGPVRHLTAFSALAFPHKGPGTEGLALGPDISVGCLTFASGMVARITCGLAAPRDRSLTVMGDTGTLTVADLWDDRSPIYVAKDDARTLAEKIVSKIEHKRGRVLPVSVTAGRRVRYPAASASRHLPAFPSQIDFARGISRQADAIKAGKAPFFSGEVALHLTELALALNAGLSDYTLRSHFAWPLDT